MRRTMMVFGVLLLMLGTYSIGRSDVGRSNVGAADSDCQSFKETGKSVCGAFLAYWTTNGGLAQQGYPISDPMSETSDTDGKTYTVQYFERAVFEMHPEKSPPNDVLLSLLGSQKYKAKYGGGSATSTPAPIVAAPSPTSVPATATPAPAAVTATSTSIANTIPVSVTSLTSPVAHGANATISVKTVPTAVCAIDVEYASGKSTVPGLSDKTAAANGVVGWTWNVGSGTTAGGWPVTVTCKVSGVTGTIQTTLQVT